MWETRPEPWIRVGESAHLLGAYNLGAFCKPDLQIRVGGSAHLLAAYILGAYTIPEPLIWVGNKHTPAGSRCSGSLQWPRATG